MIDLTYLPQLIVGYNSTEEFSDLIHISNAEPGKDYYCPCCNGVIRMRASKSKKIQPHYYHLNSECDKETQIHWIYKNFLFTENSQFYINKELYTVKNIDIEKSWKTSIGLYRPDITVYTTNGKTMYFELYFTNSKDEDYIYKWQELGNDVVEINIKELLNSTTLDIPHFDFLYHEGIFYKKEYHKRNIYASTIGEYKEDLKRKSMSRNDYLNYKMHWEKLDYFYCQLRSLINKKISEVELLDIFSKLDLIDMYPCYENIKRTNCVKHLSPDCRNIINNKVNNDIVEYLSNICSIVKFSLKDSTDRIIKCFMDYDRNEEYINGHIVFEAKIVFTSKIHSCLKLDSLLNDCLKKIKTIRYLDNQINCGIKKVQKLYNDTGIKLLFKGLYFGYDGVYSEKYVKKPLIHSSVETVIQCEYNQIWISDSKYLMDKEVTLDKYEIQMINKSYNSYETELIYNAIETNTIKINYLQEQLQKYVDNLYKSNEYIITINTGDMISYDLNYNINRIKRYEILINGYAIYEYSLNNQCNLQNITKNIYKNCIDIINAYYRNYKVLLYYQNRINSCKNKMWISNISFPNILSSLYNKIGKHALLLNINFKNKFYQSRLDFPQTMFVCDGITELSDEKLVNAMNSLIENLEAKGIGLYQESWCK